MTILPKKKCSGSSKGSDRVDRVDRPDRSERPDRSDRSDRSDHHQGHQGHQVHQVHQVHQGHQGTPGAAAVDFPLAHSATQSVPSSVVAGAWVSGVAPLASLTSLSTLSSLSSAGWSPPPVGIGVGGCGWATSSGGSLSPGSPDFGAESAGTKRPGNAAAYVDDAGGGPTASKRRLCERPSSQVGNAAPCVVSAEAVVGQQTAQVVRSDVAFNSTSPVGGMSPSQRCGSPAQPGPSGTAAEGYNSEDEYSHLGVNLSEEEWMEKDRRFERAIKKKGFLIKKMTEDGSCLFRAVADQVFGDQEMHQIVRKHCMDYIERNSDFYSQYVTEDIADYIERKRYLGVHGNHLEIQALSEMYNRPIQIYCYSIEPINTVGNLMNNDRNDYSPIRLCYHRGVHYNSIVDPQKATIGVGLGLPGMIPGAADRSLLNQAVRASEDSLVERTMLEDKIKATDWEATNEAIQEQVARESYLQWLRDNERRNRGYLERSSTVTSGELEHLRPRSPKANSPKPSCSSVAQAPSPIACCSVPKDQGYDLNLGPGFHLLETASVLNGLPPGMFGLDDWSESDVLSQVIAASQQEYINSLKKMKGQSSQAESEPCSSDNDKNSRDEPGGPDSQPEEDKN